MFGNDSEHTSLSSLALTPVASGHLSSMPLGETGMPLRRFGHADIRATCQIKYRSLVLQLTDLRQFGILSPQSAEGNDRNVFRVISGLCKDHRRDSLVPAE